MHYANGRAAKVGDLVRGKGYNVKHEIVGVLAHARPAACNCTVAHVGANSSISQPLFRDRNGDLKIAEGNDIVVAVELEFGQLDAFVALDRKTGEVLPPEE